MGSSVRMSQLSLSCSQVIRAAQHRPPPTYSDQLLGEQYFSEDLLIHNCSYFFLSYYLRTKKAVTGQQIKQ